MKSAEELLKSYEAKSSAIQTSTQDTIDFESRLILIWAIYDYRTGEWVRDFLVEEGHLEIKATKKKVPHDGSNSKDEDAKDAPDSQLRKVQRWRSIVEVELGLPAKGRGGITPLYRAMRQKWERVNPRPTMEQLLGGWTPKRVDYSEFFDVPRIRPVSNPAPQTPPTVGAASASPAPEPKGPSGKQSLEPEETEATRAETSKGSHSASSTTSEPILTLDPETGLPDLFQLPVVEAPTNAGSPEALGKALAPVFAAREQQLAEMHEIFQGKGANERHQIYLDAISKLDPSDASAFLCHNADIHTALRADVPGKSAWIQAFASGKRKLPKS